jgi:LmbE family N-acetylglucosaminyl deacetylase
MSAIPETPPRGFPALGSRMLFLGSHPDDIEAGAGGLLLKSVRALGRESCRCLIFSSTAEQPGNERILEELESSMRQAGLNGNDWEVAGMPNTRFPENADRIRAALEKARDGWKPDTVIVHFLDNTHQDHKCLAEQAVRIFRAQTILMYEDLNSTPRFLPNVVVGLSAEEVSAKVRLLECYKSQFRRQYHDVDYVRSIAKSRAKRHGLDWAEAYNAYQMVVRWE